MKGSLEIGGLCLFECRAAEVTRQFPDVMFMVDHCGLPYERDSATMKVWREGKYCITSGEGERVRERERGRGRGRGERQGGGGEGEFVCM